MLTFQNIYSVMQGVKTTFVVFLKNMDEHYSKTVLSIFKTLAKQYGPSHDISFVIVDAGVYKEFVQGVGLNEEDLPTFAIFNPSQRKEHFFPKDKLQFNINNAKRWLDSFIAGKLEVPKTLYSDHDSVVQINTGNLDEIVYDKEKDVLVEFYAPWCAHCATLAPQYKTLASHFRMFPTIVLGAFDAEENIVPEKFNVTALPTLLFFPANNKESPIPFKSGLRRDGNSIAHFILDHQTTIDAESVQNFKVLLKELYGDLEEFKIDIVDVKVEDEIQQEDEQISEENNE